jgi:hypothetical protein
MGQAATLTVGQLMAGDGKVQMFCSVKPTKTERKKKKV